MLVLAVLGFWTVTQLASDKLSPIWSVLPILCAIGVAFIVVVGMLTGATRSGLTADVGAPVAGVDRVVTTYDADEVTRLVEAADDGGFPALTLGYAMETVSRDGVQLAASADIAEAALDPRVQWQQLEGGRFPAAPGEALADVNRAKSTGVELGDVVRVGTGAAAVDLKVVGMVDSPPAMGASLYVPWATLAGFEDTLFISAVERADHGSDAPALVRVRGGFASS